MRGLNPDHLQTFADVVELGSFSAAAKRLNLSQPAVSLQIRQLERRLGLRLIERVGRRAQATAAGRVLLGHVQKIDAAMAETLEAMAGHRAGVVGRVRLGTGATACIYLLPPVLRSLRQRFPALELSVRTGNTPEILALLEENVIDVALVTLPAPGRAFHVTPIVEDELVAIFPATEPAPPRSLTPAALAKLTLVLYESGSHARRIVDDWFAGAGFSLKPAMELGSVEAIKRLVEAGLGCGVLPRLAFEGGVTPENLVLRPLAPRLYRHIGMVLRRDKPLDRGLQEVTKALLALAHRFAKSKASREPAAARR